MRLTVVLFVAASLAGTITARAAEPDSGWVGPAAAVRSLFFDDRVVPAGYDSPDGQAVYDGGCGCGDSHEGCGCCDGAPCGCCDGAPCGCGHQGCGCHHGGLGGLLHGLGGHGCGCCDDCYDDCCYDDCGWGLDGGHGPRVRFRAEFLPLHRTPSNEVISFDGLFTTEDFDFTFVPGVRAAAEVLVGCDSSLEVLYQGLHRWDEEVLIDLGGGNLLGASYVSQLQGGEANFWMPLHLRCHRIRAAFMFGTRYFDLHEEFNYVINGATQADIETDNRLLAAQIGFMLTGCLPRGFSVRWDGKAGGGANLTTRNTTLGAGVGQIVDFPRQEDADAAFIGDTTVTLSYQFGCHCSVYAGYYLLWVDGLALAPQQFPVPPTQIDDNGFVLFQGGVAGVEANW